MAIFLVSEGVFIPSEKCSISITGGTFILCGWTSYLIWAGGLVDSACVFIMLLGFGLVCHTVGLVHWCHVVHKGDGLHSLMNSTADGLADLSGRRSPGGWKVMGGLKRITEGIVIKRRWLQESELYKRVITPFLGVLWSRFL